MELKTYYLCYQNKYETCWTCQEFPGFLEADKFFQEKVQNDKIHISTMLSVFKYMPFHQHIIQNKLKRRFGKVNIEPNFDEIEYKKNV